MRVTLTTILRSLGFVVLVGAALPSGVRAQAAPGQVSFTKDIAPILQRSCQRCHRPDAAAPMSLITYEEVRPWAKAIKRRTALRDKPGAMPPWFMERNIGIQRYKDDPSLSDEELAMIAGWADNGAPRGNPADMPPPVMFAPADEWQLGQPDIIVKAPSVTMKAGAPDFFGVLRAVDVGNTEDRYVSSVEVREFTETKYQASGRRTVGGRYLFHHAAFATFADVSEMRQQGVGAWPIHEVGRNGDVLDPAAGKLLKAHSKLMFNTIHMHSNGQDTSAHLEVGFRFHPKGYAPAFQTRLLAVGNGPDIDIRGNEANQKMEAFYTLPQPVKITVFEPHLHAPGVRQCLEAIWGLTTETLSCAGYDHSWVRAYAYADDAAPLLPKGTILRVTGYFDTSSANRNVVDPRNWSGSGHRSIDNMMINLMQANFLTEEQFQQEMARRRQTLRLTEGQTVIGCPLCGQKPPQNVGNQ